MAPRAGDRFLVWISQTMRPPASTCLRGLVLGSLAASDIGVWRPGEWRGLDGAPVAFEERDALTSVSA